MVARKEKQVPAPAILAENLGRLIEHHPEYKVQGTLGRKAGVSQSTIGRMRSGKVASQIDSIQKVAEVFGLATWQLLAPGLDPARPPRLAISEEERKNIAKLRSAARDILGTEADEFPTLPLSTPPKRLK